MNPPAPVTRTCLPFKFITSLPVPLTIFSISRFEPAPIQTAKIESDFALRKSDSIYIHDPTRKKGLRFIAAVSDTYREKTQGLTEKISFSTGPLLKAADSDERGTLLLITCSSLPTILTVKLS